jgi:hypothetical protein
MVDLNKLKTGRVMLLDMDGTIADLFNEPDWAGILRGHVENPYIQCGKVNPVEVLHLFRKLKPMITHKELMEFAARYADEVLICTMVPWDATEEVKFACYAGKKAFLCRHFPGLETRMIVIEHLDNKNLESPEDIYAENIGIKPIGQSELIWRPNETTILVDDSELFRSTFKGKAMLPPWIERPM